MKKTELVRYRVFDKDGRYHQSYFYKEDAEFCAKRIGGKIKKVEEDK